MLHFKSLSLNVERLSSENSGQNTLNEFTTVVFHFFFYRKKFLCIVYLGLIYFFKLRNNSLILPKWRTARQCLFELKAHNWRSYILYMDNFWITTFFSISHITINYWIFLMLILRINLNTGCLFYYSFRQVF